MVKQVNIKVPEQDKNVVIPIFNNENACPNLQKKVEFNYEHLIDKSYGKITEFYVSEKVPFKKIIYIGLGNPNEITKLKYQEALGKFFKNTDEDLLLNLKRVGFYNQQELAYLSTEAFELSKYQYKNVNKNILEILALEDISKSIKKGLIYSKAINNARHLGNTPSNLLTPKDLANYAINLANENNLEIEVLTNKELEKIGAYSLLAVNKGSTNEARLITIKYTVDRNKPYIALVGKGITFDSGGYSLKPGGGRDMKTDMCGAANCLSVMEIISKFKLNKNVMVVIPSTENLIGPDAYKVDDVIKSLQGKTIEITNTDAEGRLILIDALEYAQRNNATTIIDMATLTGACVQALGNIYTGCFSNSDELYNDILDTSIESNEKIWRLPLDEEFTKELKNTKVADIMNSIRIGAGASVAACFLQEFIHPNIEWMHLDIAGTSTTNGNSLCEKGCTGVMVKTLSNYILDK